MSKMLTMAAVCTLALGLAGTAYAQKPAKKVEPVKKEVTQKAKKEHADHDCCQGKSGDHECANKAAGTCDHDHGKHATTAKSDKRAVKRDLKQNLMEAGSDVNSKLTKKYNLKVSEGVVVTGFARHSIAKAAGLHEGDVITQVDGTKVRSMAELQQLMSKLRSNDKVKVLLNRGGQEHTLSVELKQLFEAAEAVRSVVKK